MKKTIYLLLASCFLILASPVSAHVLESNGSIGAVMHISPDDDPVAGQPSGFFFEFKDKDGKFKPKDCECVVSILQGNTEMFSQQLFQNSTDPSLENASFTYTFPEKNVYTVKIVGKPNSSDAFQPFTLKYDIRVSREATIDQQNSPNDDSFVEWFKGHTLHLIAAFMVLGIVIVGSIKQIMDSKKKNTETKEVK